jgi:hypothetical protein
MGSTSVKATLSPCDLPSNLRSALICENISSPIFLKENSEWNAALHPGLARI